MDHKMLAHESSTHTSKWIVSSHFCPTGTFLDIKARPSFKKIVCFPDLIDIWGYLNLFAKNEFSGLLYELCQTLSKILKIGQKSPKFNFDRTNGKLAEQRFELLPHTRGT